MRMFAEQNLEIIMGLIINGGNAKSDAMEAIHAARKGDFKLANQKLQVADESLINDHYFTNKDAHEKANEDDVGITLLTVHSQDYLMNAILFRDLAGEMVTVYKKMLQASID